MTSTIKIIVIFIMLAAFPFGGNAFAETKTFIKDYTYQAGELDSKESCRLLARAQVERLLYEELGSCLAEHTEVKTFRLSGTEKNLARYIIRASFSQERMQYLDQEGNVVYTSRDGKTSKSFPALEWLANLCSHIPNRGEQMVRY